MYPHFLQFTMPKVGQAAVAVLLYFCFLDSPLLQPLQGWPLLYYLIPLAAVALLSWYSRDPLGSVLSTTLIYFIIIQNQIPPKSQFLSIFNYYIYHSCYSHRIYLWPHVYLERIWHRAYHRLLIFAIF